MLWSLLKILLFVVIVGALTFGAGALMEAGSSIRLDIGTTEFTLSPLAAVIGAFVLLGVIWIVFKFVGFAIAVLKFLNGDETAISRYFLRNRERRGFEAMADGLMALASGEGKLALLKAQRAEKFLNRPHLTNLISAQAAEMAGDHVKAEEVYKRLLQDERTRFVGVRGIMKQKLASGDTTTALRLAEKAFALKPKHEETQDVLLRLQAESDDWIGARKTLAAKLRSGSLPRDVHKRRDSVLSYAAARDALAEGDNKEAEAMAVEANRLAPTLVPAAALAANLHLKSGKPKQAIKVIKKAWDDAPHPDLAAAFAEIVPEETPDARLKRFGPLLQAHPDHSETRMLKAELNLACEDYPNARRALGDLHETTPTARSHAILAAIERGEGAPDQVVRGLLAQALTASRGPQWCCEKCHNIHADWVPICSNCGAFDTLSWVEPPKSQLAIPNSSEMMPMIVGQLEDQLEEPDIPPVIEDGDPANEAAETPSQDAEIIDIAPMTTLPEESVGDPENKTSTG